MKLNQKALAFLRRNPEVVDELVQWLDGGTNKEDECPQTIGSHPYSFVCDHFCVLAFPRIGKPRKGCPCMCKSYGAEKVIATVEQYLREVVPTNPVR